MGTIINLFGKLSKKGKIIAAIVMILLFILAVTVIPAISRARYEKRVENIRHEYQQKFWEKQIEYDEIYEQYHR